MFNRGEREKARLAAETAPYRRMAIDLEVENKLQAQDFDLAVAGRHLLTSNDRYQLSTAYLHEARDHYLLANSIAETLSADGSKESPQAIETATEFVKTAYRGAKGSLETAEQITARVGFQATPGDIQKLKRTPDTLRWPSKTDISAGFMTGMVAGLDNVWANANHDYEAIQASRLVPNDFKRRLKSLVEPLLRTIMTRHKAIERVTDGGLGVETPISVLQELYKDAQAIHGVLEQVTILITMPRIQDAAFALREPYDETRPEKKSFSPSALGTPAVQETVTRPQRPQKPFSADTLGTPPVQAPRSSRPFNPDALGSSGRKKPGEFDPSVLDPKKDK